MIMENLQKGRGPEHGQGRTAEVRLARSLRRGVDSCRRQVQREGRDGKAGGDLHRAGAWDRRGIAHQRGGEGGRQGRGLRHTARLRLCLRSARDRRGQALRQAHRPARADEPRPVDGRGPAQEDRGRQPVHGLRRAGRGDHRRGKDGKITVEIKGVDVYDPTTGAIRSSSTDDIACWFIDTNYNGESFFVRHAYFTGAESPTRSSNVPCGPRSTRPPGRAVQHDQPPLRPARNRQDRREGHQPLRRRSAEGLRSQVFRVN